MEREYKERDDYFLDFTTADFCKRRIQCSMQEFIDVGEGAPWFLGTLWKGKEEHRKYLASKESIFFKRLNVVYGEWFIDLREEPLSGEEAEQARGDSSSTD